jgi:hypothetical protein
MTKRTYKTDESGKLSEVIEPIGVSPEVKAAAIHQDTLSPPLRHPVTGRMHDSKSQYLRDCEQTGTRVVGNDWLGLERVRPADDKVDDQRIMDRIHKAEAILRDPAKRRERNNLSMRIAEASKEFMENGKIQVRREH